MERPLAIANSYELAVKGGNDLLVLVAASVLVLWYWRERRRRPRREEFGIFLKYVTAAQLAWLAETILKRIDFLPEIWAAISYTVLNASVAVLFLLTSRRLLDLKSRLIPEMPSRGPGIPQLRLLTQWVRYRYSPIFVVAAAAVAVTASFLDTGPRVIDTLNALLSFVGMAALGLGLSYELTREKPEFVSAMCGFSVLAYSVVQLAPIVPATLPFATVIALALKITLLVAVGSYWTLIQETERAVRDEKLRSERIGKVKQRMILALNQANAISRDVHDRVPSLVAGFGLLAEGARREIEANGCSASAIERLEGIMVNVERAKASLRGLGKMVLVEDLEEELEAWCSNLEVGDAQSQVQLNFRSKHFSKGPVADALYAIVLEATHNVMKHAGEAKITVDVEAEDRWIKAKVHDDGVGFDAENVEEGLGLRSMRHRAAELGLLLSVSSTLGQGTEIIVEASDE